MTTKEAELAEIQAKIAAEEQKVDLLKKEIADKEGKVGMTVEEQDRLAELDRLIASLQAEVADKQKKLEETETAWSDAAIEAKIKAQRPSIARRILPLVQEYRINVPLLKIVDSKIVVDEYAIFRTTGEKSRPRVKETARAAASKGNQMIEAEVSRLRYDLQNQARSAINSAKEELERARRRLLDAQSSKSRAELEIRRAVALRQAELDAAKARLEMEERLLEQLKATEEMLRAQIEQARAEAVARAAREREALLKAQEERRLSLAQEQVIKAEGELAVAQAESMTATAEREEARKQAYIEAARARAEAEEIAKQREEQARLAAQAEAAASIARLQAEEAGRKVEVAKAMPPVAAEVKPAIPTIALIALAGLGIFALAKGEEKKPTTPRGKYIAEKMKK